MLKTEKALSHWLQKTYPDVDWTRIENTCSDGMPDLHGCYNGKEFWVELKVNKPVIRSSQYSWWLRRLSKGMTNQFVMCAKGHTIELYWNAPSVLSTGNNRLLINNAPDDTFYDITDSFEQAVLLKTLAS